MYLTSLYRGSCAKFIIADEMLLASTRCLQFMELIYRGAKTTIKGYYPCTDDLVCKVKIPEKIGSVLIKFFSG